MKEKKIQVVGGIVEEAQEGDDLRYPGVAAKHQRLIGNAVDLFAAQAAYHGADLVILAHQHGDVRILVIVLVMEPADDVFHLVQVECAHGAAVVFPGLFAASFPSLDMQGQLHVSALPSPRRQGAPVSSP